MEINNRRSKSDDDLIPANQPKDFLAGSIFLSAVILAGTWIYTAGPMTQISPEGVDGKQPVVVQSISAIEEAVLPSVGAVLPVVWGDLGTKLTSVGVIDEEKFRALYKARNEFSADYEKLLSGNNPDRLRITKENSAYLLNLFWALGLASKNPILDSGEMANPKYGGPGGFASTGGWSLSEGSPMDHYSRHKFFNLNPQQQTLVDKISKGIYRPCCGNSTHFPDCNHGMAMLGFLELMASQGASEAEMWQGALTVNSYWFPGTYITIATYMENKGVSWDKVNPQEMLGFNYSSGQGYAKIASQVKAPASSASGGGCDVASGLKPSAVPIAPTRQAGGCGI